MTATSVLRYLVVGESHSFDGAQGSDLAGLIRRLCDRPHGPGGSSGLHRPKRSRHNATRPGVTLASLGVAAGSP